MNSPRSIEQAIAHEEPHFARAIKAVLTADTHALRQVLSETPALATARSRSPHGATLLHYVTANAIEDELQTNPQQIYNVICASTGEERRAAIARAQEVAQVLVDSGCEVDAAADAYGGGAEQTPLNLLVSSAHPFKAGVMPELTDLLCRAGAKLDGIEQNSSPLITALGFGHPTAVGVLIKHGCLVDNLLLAAAAGDVDYLRSLQEGDGFSTKNVQRCRSTWFHPPTDPAEVAELALVFASMCGQLEAMRFLIDNGVDLDAVPNGTFMTATPLHTAALVCQDSSVELLIELGADPTVVEPRYQGDAAAWAWEGGCSEVIARVGKYLPEFMRQREGDRAEVKEFVEAVFRDDPQALSAVIQRHSLTATILDGPWFHFDAPAVVQAKRNLDLIDCLIGAGANINQRSRWWAGGFGVLHGTDEVLADELIARGAKVDAWSAAELGRLSQLKSLVEDNPKLVQARGPDGKTPLHCARSVAVAAYLISRGADINAKCLDHESTPAQYLIADHPEVVRYLVEHGCETDIMLAAALGNLSMAERILTTNPESIRATISRADFPSSAADCIYSWTLGWYLTPHQVAAKFQQDEMVEFLLSQGDDATRYLNACLLKDETRAEAIKVGNPGVVSGLSEEQRSSLCHAARNNETELVARLLIAGLPVDVRGQHGATPLHWSAFHGNVAMTKSILLQNPPLELRDHDFQSTPVGWACHGSLNGWHQNTGDFVGVMRELLAAGCEVPRPWKPIGHPGIDELVATT